MRILKDWLRPATEAPILPPLARSLVARAFAGTPVDEVPIPTLAGFARAVARLEEADRTYLAAVERTLPRETAEAMLAAIASVRSDVAAIRESGRAASGYGDYDPLDTYVPTLRVSHGESIRAASVADQARNEASEKRAGANAALISLLTPEQVEKLTAAKAERIAAFERALREAAPADAGENLVTQLRRLADGWY